MPACKLVGWLTLSLALCLSSGCDSTEGLRPVAAVTVTNLTTDSIAVQLLERETATLVDPAPERAASEESDRLVLPGAQRSVPITQTMGYSAGKDLTLFVYRIRDGRSRFSAVLHRSDATLRADGYSVQVRPTDLAPSSNRAQAHP